MVSKLYIAISKILYRFKLVDGFPIEEIQSILKSEYGIVSSLKEIKSTIDQILSDMVDDL